jgi:putative phosphoesterase
VQEGQEVDREEALPQVVVVISDTHLPRGARRLPEACLEALRRADLILHCGDVSSLAFLEELHALGPPVHAVYGNADEPALRELLPQELVVEVGEVRIGMIHIPGPAAGREERLLRRFPGCDAIVFGHTHQPQAERHGDAWLLNPGSPTEKRRGTPFHSYLRLRVRGREIVPELVEVT